MNRRLILALFSSMLGSFLVLGVTGNAFAECSESVDLGDAERECTYTQDELVKEQDTNEAADFQLLQQCASGTSGEAEVCASPRACDGDPPGTWYSVYRDGVRIGRICLSASDRANVQRDLSAVVTQQFKQLSWPASELTIQPPKGRTLVNLDTIFFTTNAEPTVVPVRLLGQSVEIEATPTSYAWQFGDGESLTTDTPGHAYPEQDVTHTYLETATVAPSVDTTYTGRYRVGNGDWQTIDATVTVTGAPQQLTIVEAKPKLVR
jgi:hypothetical protein